MGDKLNIHLQFYTVYFSDEKWNGGANHTALFSVKVQIPNVLI